MGCTTSTNVPPERGGGFAVRQARVTSLRVDCWALTSSQWMRTANWCLQAWPGWRCNLLVSLSALGGGDDETRCLDGRIEGLAVNLLPKTVRPAITKRRVTSRPAAGF